MTDSWSPGDAGVVQLPSGRLIRGRALRRPLPAGPLPSFGVYLLGRNLPAVEWEWRWVRWPDFWLPSDRQGTVEILREALGRSGSERVEIACSGGRGRTGTALALVAILDGIEPGRAVEFVRRHYSPHAVETPWQRRFVTRFRPPSR